MKQRKINGNHARRAVAVLASVAMVASMVPSAALAEAGAPAAAGASGMQEAMTETGMSTLDGADIASGTSGTCTWVIDADGALTVRPTEGDTGTLGSWGSYKEVPWYAYSSRITSARFGQSVKAVTCYDMFGDCSSLSSVNLTGLDTSNVTDMNWMFYGCSSLASLDLTGLDTSNVTSMGYMFDGCSSLASLDLSPLDTSNVTDMQQMFCGCSSLASLDLSPLDTSNVTDMQQMFCGCSSLASLDLSPLDTSGVTDMSSMFNGCSSLASLDLSPLDTSSVWRMGGMFSGCSSLSSLDLSPLDTSNVKDMGGMFRDCSSLTTLDLSPLDTSNVPSMSYMFQGCSGLSSLDLTGLDTSNVTVMNWMFQGCSRLSSLDLTGLDTSKVSQMVYMFDGCSSLKAVTVDESKWSTGNVISSEGMFNGCASLVGGNGTAYDADHIDATYARVDGGPESETPGYFTQGQQPKPKVFSDVGDPSQWYYESVYRAVNLGLFSGYDNGTFGPGNTLTRAQLAAVMYNHGGHGAYDDVKANTTGLADVESNAWYTGAVDWAIDTGVMSGYDGGTFGPDDTITREQAATIIANYAANLTGADVEGADTSRLDAMPDAAKVDSWARKSVAWALNSGVISGKEVGGQRYVDPLAGLTRAEGAAMTVNAVDSKLLG